MSGVLFLLKEIMTSSIVTKRKELEKLYNEHNLVFEDWEPFRYSIEKALSWSDFDFEFFVYSKRGLASAIKLN